MKKWTDSAKDRLEIYLRGRIEGEALSNDEAAEVIEDWRLHVYEEVERESEPVVTLDVLESVLVRLGEGAPIDEWETGRATSKRETQMRFERPKPRIWLWLFGVVLPAGIVLFEAFAHFCGSVFFDPIPTWVHFLMVAAVPAGNAWLLRRMSQGRGHKAMAPLCGFLVIVSSFYALMFLPLLPASVLALIWMGLGLLSLTPLLACFCTWRTAAEVKSLVTAGVWRRGWRFGALGAVALLAAMEAGPIATRIGLRRALSEDAEQAEAGLAQLRAFHVRSTLLRACYEGNRGTTMATDISGWLFRGWQIPIMMLGADVWVEHDSLRVRDLFYRVSGTPFNTLRPPSWVTGNQWLSRGIGFDEVEFDSHLGGEEVAVRIRGLTMSQSRVDAHLDRSSSLGYIEWTSEFTNRSTVAREARFQVMLPEQGVVSRVTLWVNGEPREAAFASKAKVRAAYQDVAVVRQRDPVLVTACGPGRVLVQCFPVPADGGRMKIRIGMTAPLNGGRLAMPVLLEQNFALDRGLEHAIWLQSPDAFTWGGADRVSRPDGTGHSLQVMLDAPDFANDAHFAQLRDPEPEAQVWCEDQFGERGEETLQCEFRSVERPALDRCIVVIDGSRGLNNHREYLADLLEPLGDRRNLRIFLADDDWRELAASEIREASFSGGRDNTPALAEAIQQSRGAGKGAVVWIHGAQPLPGGARDRLTQLFERSAEETVLYSVALKPGGNRILEELFAFRAVTMGPRQATDGPRLRRWLTGLVDGGPERIQEWTRSAGDGEAPQGAKVWDQVARWWAAEKVRHMRRAQTNDPKQVALAAKYQLVTAYSGAVVLETAEQYRRHGLEPVDAAAAPAVPLVPEPGIIMLLLPAALFGILRRRRED